jgi:hypothetical protein
VLSMGSHRASGVVHDLARELAERPQSVAKTR